MNDFNVAIMGCGVVGGGVADILLEQSERLSARFGRKVQLTKILDLRDFTGTPYAPFMVKDAAEIFDDNTVSLVVVTIGGLDFAADMCRKSIAAGKHVVTSNKEVVAAYGPELTKLAFEKGVRFLYEASCGGGIPIIRPMNICLASNNLTEIAGILNGTTNYILTRMEDAGISFDEALKEAQAKGYAEANPTADVDGFDAARKIAILSSVAYDKFIDYKDVPCTGIRAITLDDMNFASSHRAKIKLIGRSVLAEDGTVSISVAPMMISNDNMLSGVSSVYNSIMTRGSYTDYTMFYGQGAGKLATASAVCGDIIEVLGGNNVPTLPGFVDNNAALATADNELCQRYMRFTNLSYNFSQQIVDFVDFYKFDADKNILQILTRKMDGETLARFEAYLKEKFEITADVTLKAFAF